jgi:hypothetical protein
MQWDVYQEFNVVTDLLASASRSKGVDAFALSLLKAERHARRMFTFLVFQSSSFGKEQISQLRAALVNHEKFAFTSVLAGIDLISPYSLTELCGDRHARLLTHLPMIKSRRNKIFHGQLTHESLTTKELASMATVLIDWSIALAVGGANKLGYDGFISESFVKSADVEFSHSLKKQLATVADYAIFLNECHLAAIPKRLAKKAAAVTQQA